ncbi:Bug family tripartite tricarboxylate transporter substrate binding protein [Azohydromonas caseinilytica]|uniref:Tripartite tricarboxylate transporter substrate binding protein n=1 Tax=Azohydromonas caseinilytica TaxID=2728836 RepID=A0A848FET0_9BURK|nr:tripartite tricarboxylate transporter substrate binding protein [Azohydromonas caseinilytica]NML16773.1 tripartite tricarboxylate transporter substrate binding protein [Azohydromonas caseinilytica]
MRFSTGRRAFVAGAAAALAFSTLPVLAQNDKPLRVILPVSTGSGVDAIMRAIGPAFSKALGQPVVIENLPGAGGITGTQTLVKAAPDGQTIAVVSNNHVVNPSIYKKMPFDSLADITPITVGGATPFVLVANAERVPARNVKELTVLLKAKRDGVSYASSGNGTILHLASAMVLDEAGAKALHVPYKGVGPMVTDLVGGQVDFGVVSVPSVVPHIKSGKLRAIGVTGKERIAALPDVPTVAEQGLPGVDVAGWFALVGPAKLPPEQVKRIYNAFITAANTPEVKQAMDKQVTILNPMTPEASAQYFRNEQERYARIVKKANITME